jgi:pyruvate kinase
VREIDAIIEASDIIMIARGDLGIECPLEELPIIQRRIAKHCISIGRPVIVATHMLESMIENPGPTRAEITDIANAVFEQADAIMLSGETTVGKYPVECVRIFDRVAKRIERSGGAGYSDEAVIVDPRHKMVKSAVVLANSFPNSKLVIFTRRGIMATYASQLRPDHSPIFAFSPDEIIVRRMALNRATHAIRMPFDIRPEHTVADAEAILIKQGFVKSGDCLVVVSDVRAGDERFDSVHLREIP